MSKRGRGFGRGRGRGGPIPQVGAKNIITERDDQRQTLSSSSSDSSQSSSAGRGRGRRLHDTEGSGGSSTEELTEKFKQLPVGTGESVNPSDKKTESQLAVRPNFGSAGRPIDLLTNYFQLQHKLQRVYHYDVEINSLDQIRKYGKAPKKMTSAEATEAKLSRIEHQLDKNVGKLKCKEIFAALVRSKALESFHPIYDGMKNIYTTKPFPFFSPETPKMKFEIELETSGRRRRYEVLIQPVHKSDLTNVIDFKSMKGQPFEVQQEMLNVLNNVMCHRKADTTQVQIGRSFFYLNQRNPINLGDGLEIWFGYNQNIHLTQRGLAVVINLAAKAFHKAGPALDYVSDVLQRDVRNGGGPFKHFEKSKIENALKGVQVYVTHLRYKKKHIIQGLTSEIASRLQMDSSGSIADYYQSKYKKLQFPNLPCFVMKAGKQTYIPIENCVIPEGQPKLGKMNAAVNAKMIRQTAIPPDRRFDEIYKSAASVRQESGEKMSQFNLQMDLQSLSVRGRVINAPALMYLNSSSSPDGRGVWRMENKNFYRVSADIQSWILLSFEERCRDQTLHKFADTFVQTAKRVGLSFGKFHGIRKFGYRDAAEQALKVAESSKASFAVIVISKNNNSHNYDEIKFIADYRMGLVTQCIDPQVMERMNDQIANNICLKVNTKLGGVNHVLENRPRIFSKPVIVFGADAVHSMRDSPCPSIASVVGSLDAFASKYKVECRVQENQSASKISQEIILELRQMVASILKAFYHSTKGKYPEKILFFRDGVSEGQFKCVREEEVHAVQKACEDVAGYIIPLTFVVVQKRHQTRLRPKNPRDGVNKTGNVPPGTTVDNDITHPDRFDYFLNSHEGIQGTSKPAHYTVLHDDNDFSADELQSLSYHLCYTYSKCNRSISIPTPVMYADLACYRAKKYADFHLQKERDAVSRSSRISDSNVKLPDHVKKAINSMGDFKNAMFFV